MRYFTRAWCRGEYTDEEAAAAAAAYARRLEEIAPRPLPPDLRALSRFSLNDARFKAVAFDQMARRLALRLRCGDFQRGYFDLVMRYDDAGLLDRTPNGMAALVNDAGAEALYDEVDELGPGRFEHRIILWPEGEVTIQFTAFTFSRTEVPSRDAP